MNLAVWPWEDGVNKLRRHAISVNKTYLPWEGPFISTKHKGLLGWRKRYKLSFWVVFYKEAEEFDQNFVEKKIKELK